MTKQNLQRIEATLEYLSSPQPSAQMQTSPSLPAATNRVVQKMPSFQIPAARGQKPRSLEFFAVRSPRSGSSQPSAPSTASVSASAAAATLTSKTVRPFPVQQICPSTPVLPKLKLPRFSSHRHAFNSALPMTLLKEIEALVAEWQAQLQETLLQIQKLYAEGPIVDGWLDADEPGSSGAQSDQTTLRNAEVDQLINYVEQLCQSSPEFSPAALPGDPHKRYRLCGLDPDGRLWSRPCPPEQLATVSMAIARYRKLRLLLNRKQQLEVRLRQAAEALMEAQAHLQKTFAPE